MLSASPGQPCQPAGSRLMLNPLGPGPGVLWVPKKCQGSCCVIIRSPQPEAAVWLAWLKPADPRKAVCSFLGAWGSQGIGRVSTEWRNPQMGDLFACPAEPHICLGAQFFPRPPFHVGRLQVASLALPWGAELPAHEQPLVMPACVLLGLSTECRLHVLLLGLPPLPCGPSWHLSMGAQQMSGVACGTSCGGEPWCGCPARAESQEARGEGRLWGSPAGVPASTQPAL